MAKWSEKVMAETPEGWKEQPMGSVSNQWAGHEGCEHCNCKDGHYSFCLKKDGPSDEEWVKVTVQPAYYDLFVVLQQALWQAQNGKGRERHADSDDQAFTDQPALTITRAVGLGFPLGQAMKKIQESQRMDIDAAKRELLGAINYLAAAILFLNE